MDLICGNLFALSNSETLPTFFVLDFCFDILNGVAWFNFKGDGLPSESFDKDLHATSQTENQMECRLLLNIVVGQGATIFQLLAGKDQTLLIRWDTYGLIKRDD